MRSRSPLYRRTSTAMPLWLMSSHVAPDGIAVDHGRAVATYQVPTGLVLQAGDRIAIGCNGGASLAACTRTRSWCWSIAFFHVFCKITITQRRKR